MGLNRITAGALMLMFTVLVEARTPLHHWAIPIIAWLLCGAALMSFLRLLPRFSVARRSAAIVLDVGGVTIMMGAGGETTAFLYVVYLWIIIGNGFRFGGRYIFAASLASAAGFGLLAALEPFWHRHLSLSLGMMSGLVILPAYAFALIRQLAQARKEAERADRAKSLFLAGVSHELRTPLNAIIGTAELLQATALDARQLDMVATINTAADGQLSLIQDVLEFSRIEVGGARTELKPFDLAQLLGAVRSLSAVAARRKGLLVSTYITARTPLLLNGDERHLREVLLNLCGNAIKFTSAGSVTIAADGVETDGGAVRLRLEVVDTGIGIAPEAHESVFGLFTQGDPSILDRFGGTGLGLALCKRQILLMGGSIGVDSAPAKGSTFWVDLELSQETAGPVVRRAAEFVVLSNDPVWTRGVRLRLAAFETAASSGLRIAFVQQGSGVPVQPGIDAAIEVVPQVIAGLPPHAVRERFATSVGQECAHAEIERALRIATAQAAATPGSATPARRPEHAPDGPTSVGVAALRVLIADDNALNRSIVSRMLESAGFRAVLADDGEEALAILTRGDVDVALLDVNMPMMDGVQTAELYNLAVLGNRRIPLIALTADATPQTRARCLQAGMQACLVKPVRTVELIEALEAFIPGWSGDNVVSFTPRAEPAPALDLQVLADLRGLGGASFLEQVVETFKLDGAAVLGQLEAFCLAGDVDRFRSEAHSLSSIGANVGAKALRDLCHSWRMLSEAALRQDGPVLMAKLHREWRRTCATFDRHVAGEHGPARDAFPDP